MKNKKLFIIAMCLLLAGFFTVNAFKEKKKVLFPEREYIKKHSEVFFKKVNLNFPPISRVEFFVKTATYPSAYINLSEVMTKNQYLKKILPQFQKNHGPLIDTFNEKYKKNLRIESSHQLPGELNIKKSTLQLLLIFNIYNDYMNSKLSGKNAFNLWNIFLKMTEQAYKEKGKTAERAAVLSFSAHFVFFKKAKKWQKKAKKILKKIPPDSIDDPDVLLILEKGKEG